MDLGEGNYETRTWSIRNVEIQGCWRMRFYEETLHKPGEMDWRSAWHGYEKEQFSGEAPTIA